MYFRNTFDKDTKSFKNLNKFQKVFGVVIGCLIPCVLFFLFENVIWAIGGNIGNALYHQGYFFEPWTIDKQLPIIGQFLPFYQTALFFWVLGSMYLYLSRGPKYYYKMLSIASFIFLFTLIIYIVYPTYSKPLASFGIEQITNNPQIAFANQIKKTLESGMGFSALPSQHATCTLLICFALFDFQKQDGSFGMNRPSEYFKKLKNQKWYFTLINTILLIYAFVICLSTFFLKQHYFLDWIASVVLCIPCYLLGSYLDRFNYLRKYFYIFFSNFNTMCGFENSSSKNSWGYKSHTYIHNKNYKNYQYCLIDIAFSLLAVLIFILILYINVLITIPFAGFK